MSITGESNGGTLLTTSSAISVIRFDRSTNLLVKDLKISAGATNAVGVDLFADDGSIIVLQYKLEFDYETLQQSSRFCMMSPSSGL